IVPAGVAPPGGKRGARLGAHGKRAARKTVGLEAALVDNDAMPVEALDASDLVRILQTSSPATVARTLSRLLDHPSAGPPTDLALARFRALFGGRSGV